jgi:diguanylate cyclase (GGDEF)-like protein/PAS domain S-box-containing protein
MRTISLFGLGIALLFASGTGLAWWVGDRVARSVQVLKNSAVALAGGEAQMVPRVHFREANEVADAMAHTAQLLTQRTDALQASHTALQESEERYRALVEWSPEAIVVHRDGKLLYVNAAAIRMFGAIAEVDVVGKSIVDWVHPDSQRLMLERVRKYVEHGDALPMIGMRLVRVDGTVIDVEVQGTGIVYKGKPAIQSSMRDITVRKQAQEVRRWAALLFANIQDGAVVTDQNGTILAVNPAFTYITGYSEADILGQNMRRLQSGRQDRAFYQQMWHTILTTGGWQGEIWNRRMNGEIYLERLTIHAALDEQGTVVNYVSTSTDLTHVKRADQMAHLAHHDALTGLPNRLQLLSRLEHALETAKRHCNMGGVLFFDLDRFKAVNDTWGHPAGDDLLQQVARRLSTRMRDMDTLARFGGDEFVAVLEGLDGPQSVATLAGELVQLLGLPFTLAGGQEVHIGGSIGIAMFPTDGDSVETLLRHADTALYRAKADGRNTYRFHVG